MGLSEQRVCSNASLTEPPHEREQVRPRVSSSLNIADFAIHHALDAFDALDVARPDGFQHGVIAMLLDSNDRPILACVVDDAPTDNFDAIVDLICELKRSGSNFDGLLLGLFRRGSARPSVDPATNPESIHVDGLEIDTWERAATDLRGFGVALIDVVVFESDCWYAWSERIADLQ